MSLSDKERKHIEEIIKANEWFTYEEAESQIRKYWNSDNNKKGNYLSIQRRQLQKIIRSDIKGTYLKINERKPSTTDEEWLEQTAYKGWSKNHFLPNKIEKLHVFPKYDYLFKENEQSIVLSALDDKFYDRKKSNMRDIYEKMYGTPGKGKTKYLMTKPYLFALKLEIERREYPTKTLYCQPDSPKYILQYFGQTNFRDKLFENIDHLIDNFGLKIEKEIEAQNNAKKAERGRYEYIFNSINSWKCIYPNILNISNLKKENIYIYSEFVNKANEVKKEFTFNFDTEKEKEKLHKKFSEDQNVNLSDSELKEKIMKTVYSFETYTLTKLKLKLEDENILESQVSYTRYLFSKFLLNYLRNNNADEFMIAAFKQMIS